MSKAEILAELPKLSAEERQEILVQLGQIDEAAGPTVGERLLLDEAQAAYAATPLRVLLGRKCRLGCARTHALDPAGSSRSRTGHDFRVSLV